MSTEFKVGDRIKNIGDTSSQPNGGKLGIVSVIDGSSVHIIYDDGCQGVDRPPYEHYQKINSNSIIMSLKSLVRSIKRMEPEKSFFKADIINDCDEFTDEGKDLFFDFLVEKFKDDFKKDVVDPILEKMKEEKE